MQSDTSRNSSKPSHGSSSTTVLAILCCLLLFPAVAMPDEIRVSKQGPFRTIKMALNFAKSGDTILVESGVYSERVIIDKPVRVVGKDTGDGQPVIDGRSSGNVVTLAAHGISIEGFVIRNSGNAEDTKNFSGDAGMLVRSNRNRILRNRIENNAWGLLLMQSNANLVSGNTISDNRKEGIQLMDASNNRLENNLVSGNKIGMTVTLLIYEENRDETTYEPGSHHNRIERNSVEDNILHGIMLSGGDFNTIIDNRVIRTRRLPVREVRKEAEEYNLTPRELMRGGNGSAISLHCYSDRNRIEANSVTENEGPGIELQITHKNSIIDNSIGSNESGILVSQSTSNTIERNRVHDNDVYGIRIDRMTKHPQVASGSNLISNNDLQGNRINAFDSSDKTRDEYVMYKNIENLLSSETSQKFLTELTAVQRRNHFTVEEMQRDSVASNQWDRNGIGNHYDNFDERREGFMDDNGDGIGETGYAIPGGRAVDHFPLQATDHGSTIDQMFRGSDSTIRDQ